jgi:hypothetical protein
MSYQTFHEPVSRAYIACPVKALPGIILGLPLIVCPTAKPFCKLPLHHPWNSYQTQSSNCNFASASTQQEAFFHHTRFAQAKPRIRLL